MIQVICFNCKTELTYTHSPGFREECSKCGSDVRVCKNCQFYDPKAYNECHETSAEVVREKERSNRCDYFSPGVRGGSVSKGPHDLRAAAEALFKKK